MRSACRTRRATGSASAAPSGEVSTIQADPGIVQQYWRGYGMNWGELLGGWTGSLGFGGVAGVVVGYTAKKVTKLVALGLGLTFILLQVLVYEGFIAVDWGAVQNSAETLWRDPQGITLADRTWQILSANLPFGGGFVAGFAIGFKLG